MSADIDNKNGIMSMLIVSPKILFTEKASVGIFLLKVCLSYLGR